jgi:Metallo-peptidase family M12
MADKSIRTQPANALHIRAQEAARLLGLPPDASRAHLVSALAGSRVLEPTLPTAADDSHDLDDVFRVIPPEGVSARPLVRVRATPPKLPSRLPKYAIKVHAVLCSNKDGSQAVTHTKSELVTVLKNLSNFYYAAGLSFVLSNVTVLPRTDINQDFTIPAGLDYASEAQPMTKAEIDKSFDEHNAKRNEWAAEHHGEMVIFFRYGTKFVYNANLKTWEVKPATASFSYRDLEFVAIINEAVIEDDLLAHESGHYFHLDHTYNTLVSLKKEEAALYPKPDTSQSDRDGGLAILRARFAEAIRGYVDDKGNPPDNGLDVFNADGIADTPPDPGTAIFHYENYGKACDGGTITVDVNLKSGTRPYSVTACTDMLMSYFFRCDGPKRFSELQIDRIRQSLEQAVFTGTCTTDAGTVRPVLSRHHLIAIKKPPLIVEVLTFPRRLFRAAVRVFRPTTSVPAP